MSTAPRPRSLARALAGALLAGSAAAACGSPPAAAPTTTQPAQGLRVSSTVLPWRLPSPVSREAVAVQGSDLVVLGGLDPSDTSTGSVYTLALPGGRPSTVGELPRAVHDAGGASLGSSAFVFGGGSSTLTSDVQALPSGGGPSVVSHLPSPRADLTAASLSGHAYLVGGYDGSAMQPDVLTTSDGSSFRTLAALPQPVRYAAVAGVGSYLYVFGGQTSLSGSPVQATADIQRIDVDTGAAAVVGQLPAPLSDAGAVSVGSQVLVMGGRSSSGSPTASLLGFDPSNGSVHNVGTLPYPVADFGEATAGGVTYLVGGEGPATLSSVTAVQASAPGGRGSG